MVLLSNWEGESLFLVALVASPGLLGILGIGSLVEAASPPLPSSHIAFSRNPCLFPNSLFFISYTGLGRTLLLYDFTLIMSNNAISK